MDKKTMDTREIKRRIRKKRAGKMLKSALVVLLFAAAAMGAVYALTPMLTGNTADAPAESQAYQTAAAQTGGIRRTVYGAGSAQPVSQPGVYAKVDATVIKTHVGMGDTVKAGDILAELESDTLRSEIEQLAYDLTTAQQSVEDVETYSRMKYRQLYWDDGTPRMDVDTGEPLTAEYSNELSIRAPGAGRIVAVYIEPGDDALAVYREKGSVMVLSTDGRSKVCLEGLAPGRLALGGTVRIVGEGIDATGTVENLARRGMEATIVLEGDEYGFDFPVEVLTMDGEKLADGTLEINKPLMVSAYGGTIRTVAARVGQVVEDDEPLARFTYLSTPLYIENATVLRDYAVAKTALETATDKLNNLTITAPCDGKVVSVDVKAGDDVVAGDQLLTIVEDAGMQIILTVDELDIPLVKEGQRVTMSVDALEGMTIEGKVWKIAPLGNTETSVTMYDVYILADTIDERVMGGMNVSGEILVETVENAVLIKTDALGKDADGYFVTMESGEIRRVRTGIMTVEDTQILSGLEAGETVVY